MFHNFLHGHDVLGGCLLGKAQAFELLFTRILLHAIGRLWGRWLAKFAQLILTITITDRGFSLLNRFIAGESQEIG